MPTYRYLCRACSHEFELFQSITASAKRKCPECGKLRLERLIGMGAGVIFKGSGFYETDYRSASYKAGEKAASESTKPSGSESKSSGGKSSEGKGSGGKDSGGKGSGESSGGASSKKPATADKP